MKNFKKLLSAITVCAMLAAGASAPIPVSAADDINVIVNGKTVKFDVPPTIISDRTLVPMRAIFEAMGCTVDYDAASQRITAKNSSKTIILNVNNVSMVVTDQTTGSKTITLEVPPTIIDDRTLVPVRAISEALDANVGWDGESRTVIVSSVTYLYNMTGNDGRRAGLAKGNMSVDNKIIKLSVDKTTANNGSNESMSFIEYDTNGKYRTFQATITGTGNTYFRVIADGETVYTSDKGFSKNGLPVEVKADIKNCRTLRIEAFGVTGGASGYIQMEGAKVIG